MLKKYVLFSLLFVPQGISAMWSCSKPKPKQREVWEQKEEMPEQEIPEQEMPEQEIPAAQAIVDEEPQEARQESLYSMASATARTMQFLQTREEIEALIFQELPRYAESDRKMVLDYWLECVLSNKRFEKKEILQAEILLDRGADINAQALELPLLGSGQSSHRTLLQESVSLGRMKALEFLLEHGADFIKLNSYTGQSVLHMAAERSREKKACTLIGILAERLPIDYLSGEPDPDFAKNCCYAGETALWTVLRDREPSAKVVQTLLKRGAQPNYPHPVLGKLPLDYSLGMLSAAERDLNFLYGFTPVKERQDAYFINKEDSAKEKRKKMHDIAKALYCFGADSVLLSRERREEFERAREEFLLSDDYLEYKYDVFVADQKDQDGADNNAADNGCVIL